MSGWHDDENARIAFAELDIRERVAVALMDENGLQPTHAALDVIMAVVRSTEWTDEQHGKAQAQRARDEIGGAVPDVLRYALDAEQKLRLLRKCERQARR
jgi:hypothetical protein